MRAPPTPPVPYLSTPLQDSFNCLPAERMFAELVTLQLYLRTEAPEAVSDVFKDSASYVDVAAVTRSDWSLRATKRNPVRALSRRQVQNKHGKTNICSCCLNYGRAVEQPEPHSCF